MSSLFQYVQRSLTRFLLPWLHGCLHPGGQQAPILPGPSTAIPGSSLLSQDGGCKTSPQEKPGELYVGLGSPEHNMQQLLSPRQLLLSGRKRLLPAPALKLPGRSFALGGIIPVLARGKTIQHTLLVFAFGLWQLACILHLLVTRKMNHQFHFKKVQGKERKHEKTPSRARQSTKTDEEAVLGTWPPLQKS